MKMRAEVEWRPFNEAPPNVFHAALAGVIQCDCGKGGHIIATASRVRGEWIVNCQHVVEWKLFMKIPTPKGWGPQ